MVALQFYELGESNTCPRTYCECLNARLVLSLIHI